MSDLDQAASLETSFTVSVVGRSSKNPFGSGLLQEEAARTRSVTTTKPSELAAAQYEFLSP
jgi:hypothetical protein